MMKRSEKCISIGRRVLTGGTWGCMGLGVEEASIGIRSDVHRLRSITNLVNKSRYQKIEASRPWINQRMFGTLPPHTKLGMPALSPTMSQGNLVEWKVKEGQVVAAGDLLADVETDKATLGWENQDDGVIAKLLVGAGTQGIDVGQVVAIVVDEESDVAAFKDYVEELSKSSESLEQKEVPKEETETANAINASGQEVNARLGPAARMLMEMYGLDVSNVIPSGPNGIITKGDILLAKEKGVSKETTKPSMKATGTMPDAKPVAMSETPKGSDVRVQISSEEEVDYIDIPTSNIRKIIASRLLESKTTVPHMFVSADIKLDKIAEMRAALLSRGTKISVNDCVIRAAALALEEVPAANAMWDSQEGRPSHSTAIDISVAVATKNGLFTPIVTDANKKSLIEISKTVKSLAQKAKENKLKPEEFQGGSFSVSNLGMFGVDSFSAIINPPQACIMAVGGARKVAKFMPSGEPGTVTEMTVTLSADSRVYDGQTAADFLHAFKANMEDPLRLTFV
eukprot:jgi/Picsp_1/6017/NSC_03371-R1_pyruvate dehydrogenase component x